MNKNTLLKGGRFFSLEKHFIRNNKVMGKVVKAELLRLKEGDKQTIGQLTVKEDGKTVYKGCTIELPNKHNQRNISSIPEGKYTIQEEFHDILGSVVRVHNVPNRDGILFHEGNYNTNTKGCILVGQEFEDINNDGVLDIKYSALSMGEFLFALAGESVELTVKKKLI